MGKTLIALALIILFLLSGCSSGKTIKETINENNPFLISNEKKQEQILNVTNETDNSPKAVINTIRTNQTLKIASWNIANFGQTKANDNATMTKIGDVIDNYDLIAIQEVSNVNEMVDNSCSRNAQSKANPNYMLIQNKLNQYLSDDYKFQMSPQIDDERYLFIYNSSKLTLIECWVSKDINSGELCGVSETGLLKREPYQCKFLFEGKELVYQTEHTSPSNNLQELSGVQIFFDEENEKTKNIILGGDLNYDCDYFAYDIFLGYNKFTYADTTSTATTKCGYDIFVYDFTDFKEVRNGVDTTVLVKVSNHYPIWMEIKSN